MFEMFKGFIKHTENINMYIYRFITFVKITKTFAYVCPFHTYKRKNILR